jgi:exo-beta-1,3-glucanase (GH17 family)
MPYPGSKLYDGKITNWDKYNQYGNIGVPLEVSEFRNEAFYTYFSDPHYLNMVNRKFGIKAVEHIKAMIGVN